MPSLELPEHIIGRYYAEPSDIRRRSYVLIILVLATLASGVALWRGDTSRIMYIVVASLAACLATIFIKAHKASTEIDINGICVFHSKDRTSRVPWGSLGGLQIFTSSALPQAILHNGERLTLPGVPESTVSELAAILRKDLHLEIDYLIDGRPTNTH